ncbi:alpha/beta hydrolase [Paenibacillus tarimensis]
MVFKQYVALAVVQRSGKFDGRLSPKNSLKLSNSIPIFFIHSKEDLNTPYTQTRHLASIYNGPKTLWEPEQGEHAAIWNTNRAEYEKRVESFLRSIR